MRQPGSTVRAKGPAAQQPRFCRHPDKWLPIGVVIGLSGGLPVTVFPGSPGADGMSRVAYGKSGKLLGPKAVVDWPICAPACSVGMGFSTTGRGIPCDNPPQNELPWTTRLDIPTRRDPVSSGNLVRLGPGRDPAIPD